MDECKPLTGGGGPSGGMAGEVKGTHSGMSQARPLSGRRSQLDPLEFDDEEAARERAKGAMVGLRTRDCDLSH